MSAGQTRNLYPQASPFKCRTMNGQNTAGRTAAGTSHGKHTLGLGIQVHQFPALQRRHIQHRGAQHSDFLLGRQHDLQPGMGNAVIIQHCQGHGSRDSVVSAQGGATA